MMDAKIKYDTDWFQRLAQIARPFTFWEMQQEFMKALLLIRRMATEGTEGRPGAPVDTGNLTTHITVARLVAYPDRMEGAVGTSVPYGKFQEYGTGQRGAATYSEAINGTMAEGYVHGGGKHGMAWVGVPARMFLGSAAKWETENDLIPRMLKKVQELFEKLGKGKAQ